MKVKKCEYVQCVQLHNYPPSGNRSKSSVQVHNFEGMKLRTCEFVHFAQLHHSDVVKMRRCDCVRRANLHELKGSEL